MKKKLSHIICMLLVLMLALALSACGNNGGNDASPEDNTPEECEHSYTAVVTAPTCTERGYTTYTCTCGDSYIDTYVDALDHDLRNHEAKAPNCTEIGWDAYVTCERDGCEYTTYIELPIDQDAHRVENDICTLCDKNFASSGLEFRLLDNDTYEVIGMGDCKDSILYIPSTHNEKAVTSIGERAFDKCTSLTSVTIGNSVTSIGDGAFRDCKSLTSVTIGNSVTSIGDYAFSSCTCLTSVTIPDGVTSIGYGAFSSCSSLESVTIPDSVTSIGYYAFGGCSNLATINYCGTEEQWHSISKGIDWDYDAGNYTVIYNYTEE